ncbi:MAG: helix-turn-helix domain-containing protein [Muribaculaceae bacterium]|nr:helix-turn-helix domain-containing protein [Muribaculaceae bacterium]
MKAGINAYKGISPAMFLSRELKRRGITQRSLAQQAGEHYQSVNAVVKGRRKLTIGQAIGIERVLGLDEGFLMMLHTMHEIELFKNNMRKSSGLPPNIRRILFWDLDFDTLDWLRYRTFVIKRVEERGSDAEIAEIHRYYSQINS